MARYDEQIVVIDDLVAINVISDCDIFSSVLIFEQILKSIFRMVAITKNKVHTVAAIK